MKTTVQKAYMGSQRVIADSNGKVYDPQRGWVVPEQSVTLVPGPPAEHWTEIPAAWCGYVPYFKRG